MADEHPHEHPNDPLFGITLKAMLEELVENLGWEDLADQLHIRCFYSDPSISSSLKFLRRTPWARRDLEQIFLAYRWARRRRESGD